MSFIHDDFLLSTDASQRLYHEHAAKQPIIDYHNHLPPQEIASNRRFGNLYEIWLEGDHYKWRAMRAHGVGEEFCTGDAAAYDKFLAFAKTVPHTLRNPLYHWTHLELKRFFDVDVLLSEATAADVWEQAQERLQSDDLTTQGILKQFDVRALCTTDDPVDDLQHHQAIQRDGSLSTQVLPAFRPDRAFFVHRPDEWNGWLEQLAAASDVEISSCQQLLAALRKRHDYFHDQGARLSDHGMEFVPARFIDDQEAEAIFAKARKGQAADPDEHAAFSTYILEYTARLDAEKNWTKQLHVGVVRNNRSHLFETVGRDLGCDSISDVQQVKSLGAFLDRLDRAGCLPKTIVYNLNPSDNYAFATMLGNFQDGKTPGKMQLGSGWWYLDQREGMEWQMNCLSNTGLISHFVGMLTDSRSFMSFTRHEYFRRILCDLFGRDIESGQIPGDADFVGPMIERICYGNAQQFLGIG